MEEIGNRTARRSAREAVQPKRLMWFLVVGCAAALTHFCVVIALVRLFSIAPLAANVVGWIVAFGVSFSGQRYLTFRTSTAPLAQSFPRFFAISLAGFIVNETAYGLLLHRSTLRFDVSLLIVLVAVAIFTYFASRYWAFRDTKVQH